jgi:MYXO-CTERM domain-containing protein
MAQSGTPESANSQSDSASAGQSTPAQFEQQRDNGGKDWGWLGLVGLLGLAGLRRRRDPDLDRDGLSSRPARCAGSAAGSPPWFPGAPLFRAGA